MTSKRSNYYNSHPRITKDPFKHLYRRVYYVKDYERNYRDYKDRFRVCESGYTKSQGWGGLYKAWQGFLINRAQNDYEKMHYYAAGIRKIEKDMKIDLSKFPDLQMHALEYASNPENQDALEEEAENLGKDVDELATNEILGIMLVQDEKAYAK